MNPYWSAVVHELTPYVPGEQPRLADLNKLNTNENPYPPSPRVLSAIRKAAEHLRLYPDPTAAALRQAIADNFGLTPRHVFVGNGSDEVLAHTFLALLRHELPLLFPDITYSFYPVHCRLYGIAHQTVPLDDAYRIRLADYRRPAGGVIFANPNAPTGCALPAAEVEALLADRPNIPVVVDEAYVDFGGESVVPLIARFPNLLVVHTLSKSRSLAGLRVGYALGDPGLVEALERVKDSFNSYPLDRLAIAGAVAAFADREHFETTRRAVMQSRTRLVAGLAQLGFQVLPSQANFVFARHPARDGAALAAELRTRSIIVRHFRQPRIDQYLRITVGSDFQIDALLAALREILA